MTAEKLLCRMENVKWDPPFLSFEIERHGGTVLGSSRAEIQRWTIDLDRCTADCRGGSYRQIHKRNPPLDVGRIASEIAASIGAGKPDARWRFDRQGRIHVIAGIAIPADGPRQTLIGRRKRFRQALCRSLEAIGFKELSAYRFQKFGQRDT
jgi:hypothetical protein